MRQNVLLTSILVVGTVSIYVADHYLTWDLGRFAQTLLIVTILFLAKTIIDRQSTRIKDSRTRYTSRKVSSVIFLLLTIAGVMVIWVPDQQALVVSYGIIAAGVAIAMQDLIRNFAGGISILIGGAYHTGDRIEVQGKRGDVIDIGIFYTTLAELGEWISGDSNTGRLTIMPNGMVLNSNINNYTKDNDFVWDEITVRLTYDSDWQKAKGIITDITESQTKGFIAKALEDISRIEGKYLIPKWAVEPAAYVRVTDNWIELQLRYITPVRERRLISSRIHALILEAIAENKDLVLASESISVTVSS